MDTILDLPENGARFGVVSAETVSDHVHISWQYVAFDDEQQPEEHGKISYTLNDNGCSVTVAILCYPDETASDALLCTINYLPSFFSQFAGEMLFDDSFFSSFNGERRMQFTASAALCSLVDRLRAADYSSRLLRSLGQLQLCVGILNGAIENRVASLKEAEVPACRFLAFDSEREKIAEARLLMEKRDGKPFTIRELSRKVAMNECYLKKGFKALTGKTIHEFQQDLRIEKARQMLQTERMSVTDVALTLGYSSISHFSTAFKRITGLKPCELLT